MSSYFDRMGHCLEDRRELVRLVRDQYRWHLRRANENCHVADLDRLNEMMRRFERDFSDETIAGHGDDQLDSLLQRIHTFAHDLASKQIHLRGGRRLGDNPAMPY